MITRQGVLRKKSALRFVYGPVFASTYLGEVINYRYGDAYSGIYREFLPLA